MVRLADSPHPTSPRIVRIPVVDGMLSLSARIVPEPGGGYSCSVPSMPGCFSCGDDFEEAVAMITEAAQLHFSCLVDQVAATRVSRPAPTPRSRRSAVLA